MRSAAKPQSASTSRECCPGWAGGLATSIFDDEMTHRLWYDIRCQAMFDQSFRPVVAEIEPGLVVAAGGNGYAAKSANALGALAAELTRTGEWLDPELGAEAFAPASAR